MIFCAFNKSSESLANELYLLEVLMKYSFDYGVKSVHFDFDSKDAEYKKFNSFYQLETCDNECVHFHNLWGASLHKSISWENFNQSEGLKA